MLLQIRIRPYSGLNRVKPKTHIHQLILKETSSWPINNHQLTPICISFIFLQLKSDNLLVFITTDMKTHFTSKCERHRTIKNSQYCVNPLHALQQQYV